MPPLRGGERIGDVHNTLWRVIQKKYPHVLAFKCGKKAVQPAREYCGVVEHGIILRTLGIRESARMFAFGIGDPVGTQYRGTNVISTYPVQYRFGMPFATLTAAKAMRVDPGAKGVRFREIADMDPQKRGACVCFRKYRRRMMSRIGRIDRRQDGQRVRIAPEDRFNRSTIVAELAGWRLRLLRGRVSASSLSGGVGRKQSVLVRGVVSWVGYTMQDKGSQD